jgi:hypothetical protein
MLVKYAVERPVVKDMDSRRKVATVGLYDKRLIHFTNVVAQV